MRTYAVLFALAFLASLVATPLLRQLWIRLGLLDSAIHPGPHLRRPVPRLGGVVIYLAVVGTLAALLFHSNQITQEFRDQLPVFWTLLGPATLILLVGVVDDIWGMTAWVKFSAQVAASLWLISEGVRILRLSLPWGERFELGGLLSAALTLLWLVALTNAFNLIDGLDGLAAGIGFLSATAIAVTAMMVNDKMVVVVSVALAGALLGFLRHNFSPATIFLGDSGSMFVGFVLAASAVVWHQKTTTAIAIAAPLVAFALPVADTTLAVVRRTLRGQPWFASDRHHIHHRLLALGLTPRQAALLLYGVGALAALCCVLIAIARSHNVVTLAALFSILGVAASITWWMYPELFPELPLKSARSRVQLVEALQLLGSAQTWEQLSQVFGANSAILGIHRLTLVLPDREVFHWEHWLYSIDSSASERLWRLTLPFRPTGYLVVGRDPLRASSEWPLEDIALELGRVLGAIFHRLENHEATERDTVFTSRPIAQ